jgi:hypothetical protein
MDIIHLRLSLELVSRVFQATAVKMGSAMNQILPKRSVRNTSKETREKIK